MNKKTLLIPFLVLILIIVLALSPADWPVSSMERKVEIPQPKPGMGNIGGYKITLPARIVEYVEYNDSPGFDKEKLRHYNPPPRTYESILKSFSYYLRYSTGERRDWNNYSLSKFYAE
ncbi:MAG: hypothetical protein Q4C98_11830, partial [Capnocytophaga sp.]|nr:hypothetical protein [Capnocytophaga sp.]